MDAAQALADLTEISSQIRAAVMLDAAGALAASTFADDAHGREFAGRARELFEAAEQVRPGGGEPLTQLEVATDEGSVFVVRDGGQTIAAVTTPEPTVGLVFYDLKSCLRSATRDEEAEAPEAAPKRRPRKKAEEEAETPEAAAAAEGDGDAS